MRKRKLYLLILILAIPGFSISSEGKETKEKLFDYTKILNDEYKKRVGNVIPVTIWQSIETDGVFTNDGQYFFFSSDREKGNHDIYLRSLTDITTVRVTNHAARDTSPAISPDGKYLAFVSQREDPEGDIFIVEVESEDIIAEMQSSVSEIPSLDSRVKNISLYQDPNTKTIKIIKDATPCWSQDGKLITFSSTRDGRENIWVMDKEGKGISQITKKGGMYPRFSNDGKKIIFISYRNKDSNGDVYIIDVKSRKESRITSNSSIELYPTFMGNSNEIIYTLIDRDTNKDNKINLKDNSVLYYRNLQSGLEYQLTLYSEASFTPVWSPSYNGIIIYSNQIGENINVNLIPDYGVIPKKKDARQQLEALAEKYFKEYHDIEKYLMCLERVYYFFGKKNDVVSKLYVTRALKDAALIQKRLKNDNEASRFLSLITKLSQDKTTYSYATGQYLKNIFTGSPGDKILNDSINRIKQDSKNQYIAPFLMEDLGDEYRRQNKNKNAVHVYSKIIEKFSKYKRKTHVRFKIGKLTDKLLKEDLSPSYLEVLSSRSLNLRIDVNNEIIDLFKKEKDITRRIKIANAMFNKYEKIKYAPGLFKYILALSYYDKGDLKNARSNLFEGLKLSKKLTYIYYKINILLGKISEIEKKYADMERYLFAGAKGYERRYKQLEFKSIVKKLIRYYEDFGERAEADGDFEEAVKLYENYIFLLTYLNTRKLYKDIYNENAPRSHILRIDAYSKWKGNNYNDLLKLENDYNKKQNRLAQARLSLDKAHIYGLGYIYTLMALALEEKKSSLTDDVTALFTSSLREILSNLKNATTQIAWALFMDDNFIDPVLLKGWIFQNVDLKRQQDRSENGGKNIKLFSKFFPAFLWEKNISIYEKAILTNKETRSPEKEGNLHLNIANTFFLLSNYPKAFDHYLKAQKFKTNFGTKIEEAIFYYHLGYCHWQNSDLSKAKMEMKKALLIYESLASDDITGYKFQIYLLYRFFALFERIEKNYSTAIFWYNNVLEFTKKNGIKVDRARYLQEIAYCYKELNKSSIAMTYLNKADDLLKDYETGEKKYNLTIRLLGLGPFNVLDLGPDSAIFGDNRICAELNTIQKRLLNASVQEEIYYNNGDLLNAIRIMNKKLKILEGRKNKFNKDTKIRTLNNIGYCYFLLRDYAAAGNFFEQAWNYASRPDVNDLEGIFVTVLNTTNLYSFLLENGIGNIEQPASKIDTIVNRVVKYRNSYEQNKFDNEVKKLKKTAKGRAQEARNKEIEEIRVKIKEEAKEKYFKLDIAIGALKYQKAELLKKSGLSKNIEEESDLTKKANLIYKYNKNLFTLYNDAIKRFENALNKAESRQSRRLSIKLLLDIGTCQKRIGLFQKAYSVYSLAEKRAIAYNYSDLLWKIYYKTADFLMEYGKNVEGEDYLSAAKEYFENAFTIIEECPYLYKDEIYRIKSLYDDYISLQLKLDNSTGALKASERKYEMVRALMTAITSPQFHSTKDMKLYRNYIERVKKIKDVQKDLSIVFETGEPAESKKILKLKKSLKSKDAGLKKFIKNIKKNNPLLASFIVLSTDSVPVYPDAIVYKFIKSDKGVNAWKVDSGKITHKLLTGKGAKIENIVNKVSRFMQDGHRNKHRFVVLNESVFKLLSAGNDNMPPFMFITSIKRAGHYLSARSAVVSNIYNNGEELSSKLHGVDSLKEITMKESSIKNIDLTNYSVIIDQNARFNTSILFQNKFEPTIFITKTDDFNVENISQIIESSLYSGIKSLYICDKNINNDSLANITRGISQKSFDQVVIDNQLRKNVIFAGYRGLTFDERKKKLQNMKADNYKRYVREFYKGNIVESNLFLNKWFRIKSDKPKKDSARYYLNKADLALLQDNVSGAVAYNDKSLKASINFNEIQTKAISNQIFLLFYNGNFTAARDLIDKNGSNNILNKSFDFYIYNNIINLVCGKNKFALKNFETATAKKSVLPDNRLKLLFAEFLYLYNESRLVHEVLKHWSYDYPLSTREKLKIAAISKSKKNSLNFDLSASTRPRDIVAISEYSGDIKNRALLLLEKDGKYDNLSPFTAHFCLNYLFDNNRLVDALNFINEIDANKLKRKAHWLDVLPLLNIIMKAQQANMRNEDALKSSKQIVEILTTIGLPSLLKEFLYNEAMLLSELEKHNESYNRALEGFKFVEKSDKMFFKYQLLLMEEEIYIGKIDSAIKRGDKIKSNLKSEYRYVFYLLKSRIEQLKIIKKKKAALAEMDKVEKLIMSALEILDSSPGVIHKFNRIDLITEGLDFLISYNMSRKQDLKALMYAEVKKQITLRSKFRNYLSSEKLSINIIKKFKAIKKINQSKIFIELLNKYPSLQINALARIMPVNFFQKQLQANSVAIYMAANVKDVLVWIISNRSVKTIRIKNGFERLEKIIKQYRVNLSLMKSVAHISVKLFNVLKPLEKYYKEKNNIIIITDKKMESVPYEIIGEKVMLEESHNIVYLSSILSSLRRYESGKNSVKLLESGEQKIYHNLEKISIKESGIPYEKSDIITNIGHLHSKILFDSFKGELYIIGKLYIDTLKNAKMVYLPSFKIIGVSLNNFSLLNSLKGVKGVIINNANIHDVNNAVFVDSFYSKITKGENLTKAFQGAKKFLRQMKKFSYPAYWAGIRLYLNGI